MKIKHKNNHAIISEFPSYGKYHYSMYGYLVITSDHHVLFFYATPDSIEFDDVTDDYVFNS